MIPKEIELTLEHRSPHAGPPIVKLSPERIMTNNVHLPWEYNPHDVTLWVVGNEFGPMGAVWAGNDQDAIDELIDKGLAEGILIKEEDADEDTPRGGNASEPYDQTNLWLDKVQFHGLKMSQGGIYNKTQAAFLCWLAEARGANADTLDAIA